MRRTVTILGFLLACTGDRPASSKGGSASAGVRNGTAAAAVSSPADLAGYRTAMDLFDNRYHALLTVDRRLIIDAGTPDFMKYVDGGWKTSWILGARDGDRRVAFVNAISSLLFFPLDGDGDGPGLEPAKGGRLTLSMRALQPRQKLSVFVNEKPAGTIEVDTPWKDHVVAIPPGVLQPGENRLRLTFRSAGPGPAGRRSAAAIDRIALGPGDADPIGPGPHAAIAGEAALGGVRRRALSPQGPSRLSFFLQIPAGAKLAVAYGSEAAGAKAVVRLATDGQTAKVVHEGAASSVWTEAAVDIGAWAGQAVRLDLIARGGGISWADPRIVVKAAPTPAAAATTPKFDRILVWMVDTLRADKVRAYNPKTRVETPNYGAFAKDSTRFEWAHVPGTWSLPSHASLLTGVYPTVHKAVAHESRLARDVPFLAEVMKKEGFRTALFSSNGYVSSKWGFDRGWDESRNFIRESLPNGADYLWKTAKKWVIDGSAKKKFVYLATVDPHVIYNPRKEFLDRYWQKPYKGPIKPTLTGLQLGRIKSGSLKPTDTDKAYLEALHDAEITQSDAAFGQFVADLKAAGLYETSAIIVVSDHGDEFWEHGGVGHAQSVYQELTHVPLMIRAPGRFPIGKVIATDVEIMDVMPTVCDLGGVKPPDVQGVTLAPLAADEVGRSPAAALSQNGAISRGLQVARYRLIHSGPGRIELYDEIQDPREQTDVAGKRPIALRQMRNVLGLLHGYEARWSKTRWGTAANLLPGFAADNDR